MIMKTITINGKDYKVKYTIRALFLFEQITNKPFQINTLLDNYIFFYCMILANNNDSILDWDDFINAIDDDKNLMKQLTEIQMENQKKNDLVNDDVAEENNESSSKKN